VRSSLKRGILCRQAVHTLVVDVGLTLPTLLPTVDREAFLL